MLSSNPGASVYIQISVDASKYKLHLNIKYWLGKMVFICSLTPKLLLNMWHWGSCQLTQEIMLPILWRRRAAWRLMADGRKNNVKTSLFFFSPLPYISLNSLKDCLASAISSNAWANLKTNCLLSPHTHTHTHTHTHNLILSFSYTDLFTFLSLMQQLVYICFSSLTCSLFSLHPSPSHIYIQAYLLTTVFPHWSPLLKTT